MYPHAIDSTAAAHRSTPKLGGWGRWLFVGACLLGLLLASYLTALKLTGRITDLAGCGGESGCADVLGGRWANWLRVPISLWSVAIYLPLLIMGFVGLTTAWRRRLALMGTSLLVAGAIWFLFVQAVIVGHFCAYCCILHACGLIAFGYVLSQVWPTDLSERAASLLSSGAFATMGVMALVTGQVFGPQPPTHEITSDDSLRPAATSPEAAETLARRADPNGGGASAEATASPAAALPNSAPLPQDVDPLATQPGERVVSYFDGAIRMPVDRVPLIGKPSARHILVEYFDYTCASCRLMHDDLAIAIERYPDDLAVIVIPCPLNSDCNPYVEQNADASGRHAHEHACELSRLALAVWRADPSKFVAFHDKLFARQGRMTPVAATIIAESAVGENAFQSATQDPWIDAMLNHSINIYSRMKHRSPRMPKLLLGGTGVLHGVAIDSTRFMEELSRRFQLGQSTSQPIPSDP